MRLMHRQGDKTSPVCGAVSPVSLPTKTHPRLNPGHLSHPRNHLSALNFVGGGPR